MRWILLSVLAMVGFSLLTQSLLSDPGYVIVALGDVSLRMRFLPALIAWALLWLLVSFLLRLAWRFWRGLRGKGWRSAKQQQASGRVLASWLHFFEGDWPRVLRENLRQLRRQPALIPSLFAARAYAQLGEPLREGGPLQQVLEAAGQAHPKQARVIALMTSQIALEQGLVDDALQPLLAWRNQAPSDRLCLHALARVYQARGDWAAMAALLPDLHRFKVMDKAARQALEVTTYSALLQQAAQTNLDALQNAWSGLPKNLKQQESVLLAYGRGLARWGRGELAEPLVRKAISQQWSDALVSLYGQIDGVNPQQQLKDAQQWLEQQPGNLALTITLAQLCQRLHYWGQARDYWEEAHRQQPCARSFAALAELYTRLGDAARGQELYERGLTRMAELEGKL